MMIFQDSIQTIQSQVEMHNAVFAQEKEYKDSIQTIQSQGEMYYAVFTQEKEYKSLLSQLYLNTLVIIFKVISQREEKT